MLQRTNISDLQYSSTSLFRRGGGEVVAQRYEISNHLGNVVTIFSDRKIAKDDENNDGIIDNYKTYLFSSQDYTPFGMAMNGRGKNQVSGDYRFGFNGQEKDQEIYNNQSTTTATFWEYDARIGRRWNLDPVNKPSESPYLAFSGNPIFVIDPNGDDGVGYLTEINGQKTLIIKATYKTAFRFNQETKDLVNSKINAASNKDVYYNGEKVKVQFQIAFEEVDVKSAQEQKSENSGKDFNEGVNTFSFGSLPDPEIGGGNRAETVLDDSKANPAVDPEYAATAIVEEVGHNIGLLHSDGGVMSEDIIKGETKGNMTSYALQKFANRLSDMSKSKGSEDYWVNQSTDKIINKEKITGTTKIDDKYKPSK